MPLDLHTGAGFTFRQTNVKIIVLGPGCLPITQIILVVQSVYVAGRTFGNGISTFCRQVPGLLGQGRAGQRKHGDEQNDQRQRINES